MCELCIKEHITEWFHEDVLCWIAECNSCRPDIIVVHQHHKKDFDPIEIDCIEKEAEKVANKQFGSGNWKFDFARRKIPNHAHFHIRKKKG